MKAKTKRKAQTKSGTMRDVKVWLDDVRPAPAGWTWVKTAPEAIAALQAGGVEALSLDHDLGEEPGLGSGYDVATWVDEAEAFHGRLARLAWSIHSANPSASFVLALAESTRGPSVRHRIGHRKGWPRVASTRAALERFGIARMRRALESAERFWSRGDAASTPGAT